MKKIYFLVKEYGFLWILFRVIYLLKLKFKLFKIFLPSKSFDEINTIEVDKRKLKELLSDNYLPFNVHSINEYYKHKSKEQKELIIERANQISEGKIYSFNGLTIDYNFPISWFRNPLDKSTFEKKLHWSEIPDFGEGGDIKIVWEPSRFLFVYDLIKAYSLTKNEKYIVLFWNIFDDWYKENPPEQGVNWKCSQEITIRLLSITSALYFFIDSKFTSLDRIEKYIKLVDTSMNHVYKNKSYAIKSIKNDHTFTESFGLFIFGNLFSDLNKKYKKYKKHGKKQFEKEIILQFYKDGGYKQNSFNYLRIVLELISMYILVDKHNNIIRNTQINAILNKSLIFLNSAIKNEHGNVPNFGPSDSAVIFPLSSDFDNYYNIINLMSYCLRGHIIKNQKVSIETLAWFINDCNKLPVIKVDRKNTFKESGYHYIRNDNNVFQLFFRGGRQWHRPFHNDMFHLDLWYKGFNLFCDMGTYSYNSNIFNIDYYSSSLAHNTVTIIPEESFQQISKFLVVNWNHGVLESISDNEIIASRQLGNGNSHRRKIILLKNSCMIKDHVITKHSKKIIVNYNIKAEHVKKISNESLRIYLDVKNNSFLDVEIKTSSDVQFEIKRNIEEDVCEGWLSESYLTRSSIFVLRIYCLNTRNFELEMIISS